MTNFTPPTNPYDLFNDWFTQAEEKETNDPGAMCLATISNNGRPAARMVLLKKIDARGFKFHTNEQSRKGNDLKDNPNAAICFHWKSLRKQIRIEGVTSPVSKEESENYFRTRSRESQIGAWASQQSRDLESYKTLENSFEEYKHKFKNDDIIPRPDYWIGYRLQPDLFEFWQDGAHRLHQRHVYTPSDKSGWTVKMVNP